MAERVTDWAIALFICWGGFGLALAVLGCMVWAIAVYGGPALFICAWLLISLIILLVPASNIVQRRRRARGAP